LTCNILKIKFRDDDISREVVLGAHAFDWTEKMSEVAVRRIVRIAKHNYNKSLLHKHDIALIQLYEPVAYTKYIQPICLPRKDHQQHDEVMVDTTRCLAAGWGRVGESKCVLLVVWSSVDWGQMSV